MHLIEEGSEGKQTLRKENIQEDKAEWRKQVKYGKRKEYMLNILREVTFKVLQ